MTYREKGIEVKYFLTFVLCISYSFGQSFGSFIERLSQTPVERRITAAEQYLSTKKSAPIIENDTLVHFVLYGTASTVMVNGDLQGWHAPDTLHAIDCGQFSLFYRTFSVPGDARFDYTYIVDGREMLDPANPLTAPSGFGPHSELRMPKFVSSPFLIRHTEAAHGTIKDLPVSPYVIAPLKQYWRGARPLKIYLPPGYDTLTNLPVVYVQDGFEAIEFASLPTVIDNLIAQRIIEPLIAVFIEPLNRGEEQLGFFYNHYRRYICDELVPMIDTKYKTGRSPRERALIGISSGGFSALSIALSRTDIFGNVGGQSSTITQTLEDLVRHKAQTATIPASMKIYLDCGRYDLRPQSRDDFIVSNRHFSQLLSSLHIPHYYKELNDGHQWASWRERMPEMLMYFFRK